MSNVAATTYTWLGGQFEFEQNFGSGTFTAISQVTDVDESGSKWDTPDITSADNTDGVKRQQTTLFTPGTISVSILWNPQDASHIALKSTYLAGGTHNFKRILPGSFSGGTRSFQGQITELNPGKQSLDKPTTATLKVMISGPYTDS